MASSPEPEITREEVIYLLRINCCAYNYFLERGELVEAEIFRDSVNHIQLSRLSSIMEPLRTSFSELVQPTQVIGAEHASLFPHLDEALRRFDAPMEPSTPPITDEISESSFIASPRRS